MTKTGFTTGCLYKTDMQFNDKIKIYYSFGADAIEISFPTLSKLLDFSLTQEIIQDVKKYDFVSLHAPWKETRYSNDKGTEEVISKLKYLSDNFNAKGIVLHPGTIDSFSILEKSGLPFLIENMDKRKEYGIKPEHFEKLKQNCNFGFVLDLQHAYEHDSSMKLAEEFLSFMGDRLSHFHVSGTNESSEHAPLHDSSNKDSIIKILELKKEIPRISEGIILENIEEAIGKELEFLKKYN